MRATPNRPVTHTPPVPAAIEAPPAGNVMRSSSALAAPRQPHHGAALEHPDRVAVDGRHRGIAGALPGDADGRLQAAVSRIDPQQRAVAIVGDVDAARHHRDRIRIAADGRRALDAQAAPSRAAAGLRCRRSPTRCRASRPSPAACRRGRRWRSSARPPDRCAAAAGRWRRTVRQGWPRAGTAASTEATAEEAARVRWPDRCRSVSPAPATRQARQPPTPSCRPTQRSARRPARRGPSPAAAAWPAARRCWTRPASLPRRWCGRRSRRAGRSGCRSPL